MVSLRASFLEFQYYPADLAFLVVLLPRWVLDYLALQDLRYHLDVPTLLAPLAPPAVHSGQE